MWSELKKDKNDFTKLTIDDLRKNVGKPVVYIDSNNSCALMIPMFVYKDEMRAFLIPTTSVWQSQSCKYLTLEDYYISDDRDYGYYDYNCVKEFVEWR